ncbi:carbohydrate ABC transporter permease [Cohnella sp. GCM10020058]|uniref:carbohydrate ABC transporter permease n=1 Tax=Cohnella sp. GCM10020058 TaxID=3317330 RepID=UPI003635EEA5
MKIKQTPDQKLFNVAASLIVGGFGLASLIPFIVLIVGSISSENSIIRFGYSLFPREFSIEAYKRIFSDPGVILHAYGITIAITVLGTILSLFVSAMAAYVLFRKEVKYRNKLSFFLYFTTLFNGGLASFYIVINNYYDLKDKFIVLLLVPMFHVVHILILRSFMKGSLHDSLIESARMDGAGEFNIFATIALPLSKPALATIGLFTALGYWNDWWTPMLFVENRDLFPLQYVLYRVLATSEIGSAIVNTSIAIEMPKETLKLALTVISTGPIVLAYPFAQKYFVRGIMIGAVKG